MNYLNLYKNDILILILVILLKTENIHLLDNTKTMIKQTHF